MSGDEFFGDEITSPDDPEAFGRERDRFELCRFPDDEPGTDFGPEREDRAPLEIEEGECCNELEPCADCEADIALERFNDRAQRRAESGHAQ